MTPSWTENKIVAPKHGRFVAKRLSRTRQTALFRAIVCAQLPVIFCLTSATAHVDLKLPIAQTQPGAISIGQTSVPDTIIRDVTETVFAQSLPLGPGVIVNPVIASMIVLLAVLAAVAVWLWSRNRRVSARSGELLRDASTSKQAKTDEQRILEQRIEHERSHREAIEAELAKLRNEMKQQKQLAAVGQLAGNIAHELRNPLGTIRNAAYFVKSVVADPQLTKHLEIIDSEVKTANRVVSDLLEMCRGKEPQKESVNLAEAVQVAWEESHFPDQIQRHLITQPDPFIVHADRGQIVNVLRKIALNAKQAMGEQGEISVTATHDKEYDQIVVRNTGPGIAPETRMRIFDPVFTTKSKGTGLELAICRQIIEKHGGTIDLLEEEKPGATFRIRLPRKAGVEPAKKTNAE